MRAAAAYSDAVRTSAQGSACLVAGYPCSFVGWDFGHWEPCSWCVTAAT